MLVTRSMTSPGRHGRGPAWHSAQSCERFAPVVELLVLDQNLLLARALVDQPVLPFTGIAILADRCIERRVAAEPAVHVDHVLLADPHALGDQLDLFGAQVAFLKRGNL